MAKKSFYKIEMLFLKVLEQEDCYGYQLCLLYTSDAADE